MPLVDPKAVLTFDNMPSSPSAKASDPRRMAATPSTAATSPSGRSEHTDSSGGSRGIKRGVEGIDAPATQTNKSTLQLGDLDLKPAALDLNTLAPSDDPKAIGRSVPGAESGDVVLSSDDEFEIDESNPPIEMYDWHDKVQMTRICQRIQGGEAVPDDIHAVLAIVVRELKPSELKAALAVLNPKKRQPSGKKNLADKLKSVLKKVYEERALKEASSAAVDKGGDQDVAMADRASG